MWHFQVSFKSKDKRGSSTGTSISVQGPSIGASAPSVEVGSSLVAPVDTSNKFQVLQDQCADEHVFLEIKDPDFDDEDTPEPLSEQDSIKAFAFLDLDRDSLSEAPACNKDINAASDVADRPAKKPMKKYSGRRQQVKNLLQQIKQLNDMRHQHSYFVDCRSDHAPVEPTSRRYKHSKEFLARKIQKSWRDRQFFQHLQDHHCQVQGHNIHLYKSKPYVPKHVEHTYDRVQMFDAAVEVAVHTALQLKRLGLSDNDVNAKRIAEAVMRCEPDHKADCYERRQPPKPKPKPVNECCREPPDSSYASLIQARPTSERHQHEASHGDVGSSRWYA
jgi:hypothetical protein